MKLHRTVATRVVALLIACVTAAASADETTTEPAAAAPKAVLLPAYFQIFSLATASAQEAPEWSRAAERDATAALAKLVPDHGDLQLLPMPELSAEEQELLSQQLAFYRVVAGAAHGIAEPPGEYTIGSKLEFIRAKSGADKALIVFGQDIISTGGRVAFAFVAAAAGIGIPGGFGSVTVGLVDLETGRLEWVSMLPGKGNLNDTDNVYESLDRIVCAYPAATKLGRAEMPSRACGRKFEDGEVFYTPEQRRAMKEQERRMKRKKGG